MVYQQKTFWQYPPYCSQTPVGKTCAHTRWLLWGRPRCSHHTHSRPLPPPVASVEPCSDLTVLPVCHVQLTPSPPFGRRRRSEQGARPPSPARSSSGLRPRGAIRAHLAGGLGAEREVPSDTQPEGARRRRAAHTPLLGTRNGTVTLETLRQLLQKAKRQHHTAW